MCLLLTGTFFLQKTNDLRVLGLNETQIVEMQGLVHRE